MPHKTTVKLEVKVDKGPTASPSAMELQALSYMPVQKSIPADKSWQKIPIDAGASKWVEMMIVHSDRYKEPGPMDKGPGLFFKFLTRDAKGDLPKAEDGEAYPMSGPLFFSGYTRAMLPPTIDAMAFRNLTSEPCNVEILLTKTDYEEPDHVDVGKIGNGNGNGKGRNSGTA